jgi:hypothetical protein
MLPLQFVQSTSHAFARLAGKNAWFLKGWCGVESLKGYRGVGPAQLSLCRNLAHTAETIALSPQRGVISSFAVCFGSSGPNIEQQLRVNSHLRSVSKTIASIIGLRFSIAQRDALCRSSCRAVGGCRQTCPNGKTPRRRANVAALTGNCLRRTDLRIRFDRLAQLPRYDSSDRTTSFVGRPNRASWRSAGLRVPESRRDHRQFGAGQESFLGCPGLDCRAT